MTEKLPLYHKLSVVVIGLFVFFYILYLGQEILIPLIFAWIFAILLNPVVNFLVHKKFNRALAISIVIALVIVFAGGLIFFIGSQASMFSESLPQIKVKFSELVQQALTWASQTFNIATPRMNSWIEEQKSSGMKGASGLIGSTLGSVSSFILVLLILPVYIFFFLYYKPLLLQFISKLFNRNAQETVKDVLAQIKSLIQNYIVGLLIEMSIVATMNSIALLIIGIKYAILLGIIGALLNLIPYIGGLVAISLPMIMGLMTDNPMSSVYVFMAYMVIQLIDNNFLVPKIVASKVKVNALISIVVVLIGGSMWGVAGMFLSIPLTAILKVIFDRVMSLEPYGYLIGDTMPDTETSVFIYTKDQEISTPENTEKVIVNDTVDSK